LQISLFIFLETQRTAEKLLHGALFLKGYFVPVFWVLWEKN